MMQGEAITLISNAGASATGSTFQIMGGKYAIQVEGTLGAASFLHQQHPSGNFASVTGATAITVDTTVDLPPGAVRFITGGGASGVYAYLTRISGS